MSSDTAFALGAVALVTPRTATRIRVFLLTLAVVDDLAALVVIATVYAGHVSFVALGVAIVLFAGLIALRYAPFGRTAISVGLAVAICGIVSGDTIYGTGYSQVKTALESGTPLPADFGLLKFLATVFASISGIPGGIFAPSLSIGAIPTSINPHLAGRSEMVPS